jgi:two-component system LytT family response regulator
MKVLIIDDEPLARSIVRSYLTELGTYEILGEAGDGFEALKMIHSLKPDLVFLDVQMPKLNGFEMLELLEENPHIIFTTAYDEFALKAFEVSAVDYLLKPFSKERFETAINKVTKNEQSMIPTLTSELNKTNLEQARIVVKQGSDIKIIPLDSVQYIEAYDDYVKIHVEEKYHVKKQTMNYYEKNLPDQFMRIHRSFLLNIDYLQKIESFEKNSYVAILKNGNRIPISRNSYSDVKQRLGI